MLQGKTPLIIAGVLALLAGLLAYQTIYLKEKKLKEGWDLVPVVVASQDVVEGTPLDYELLAVRSIPRQFVTPSVVVPDRIDKVIGQKLMAPIQAGDLILWSLLQSFGAFEHLSNIVRKSGRALTVDIGASGGVGGWVRPNDHVDIIGTFMDPKTNQSVTLTLLQNVIVLATGGIAGGTNVSALDKSDRAYANVTLMVLPEEAELLVLADQLGGLHLSLRNPDDLGEEEERTQATMDTLLTGERVKALKSRREKTFQVIRLPGKSAESP